MCIGCRWWSATFDGCCFFKKKKPQHVVGHRGHVTNYSGLTIFWAVARLCHLFSCSGHQSTAEVPATPPPSKGTALESKFHASWQLIWWFGGHVIHTDQRACGKIYLNNGNYLFTTALNGRKWKHLQVSKLITLKTVAAVCFPYKDKNNPGFYS